MIEISSSQFIQNPIHIQNLAEKEPVIVNDGTKKQVLMSYEDFLSLNAPQKPFVSLAQMVGYTDAADIEFDEEADLSFAE